MTRPSKYDLFAQIAPDADNIYHYYFGNGDLFGIDSATNLAFQRYLLSKISIGDRLQIKNGTLFHQEVVVGQIPGYLADFAKDYPQAIELTVSKINDDIYPFDRLLCHARIDGNLAIPFQTENYQPLAIPALT